MTFGLVAVWRRWCSGRRLCRAGLLGVPVGGGPPASRPRRELRSARRLEARPGPATAHGRRYQALTRGMGPRSHRGTPRQPPPLPASLHERNIAPARSKWSKYCTFRRAGAKNISRHPTTPHAGAVFLSPQLLPCPTGGTKLTLLGSISAHARNSSPSTAKTSQELAILARRASFVAPMGATAASQHLSIASPETNGTNAGGSLPRNETDDTSAPTKRTISGHYPPAKASSVSSGV